MSLQLAAERKPPQRHHGTDRPKAETVPATAKGVPPAQRSGTPVSRSSNSCLELFRARPSEVQASLHTAGGQTPVCTTETAAHARIGRRCPRSARTAEHRTTRGEGGATATKGAPFTRRRHPSYLGGCRDRGDRRDRACSRSSRLCHSTRSPRCLTIAPTPLGPSAAGCRTSASYSRLGPGAPRLAVQQPRPRRRRAKWEPRRPNTWPHHRRGSARRERQAVQLAQARPCSSRGLACTGYRP
jgi:hypothetical protein